MEYKKVEVVQVHLTSEEAEAIKLAKKYNLPIDKRLIYVISILERLRREREEEDLMG